MASARDSQRPGRATPGSPAVVFEHVGFVPGHRRPVRRRRPVFGGLTFGIQPGEAVGFLGPPGTGKTSLIHLATGRSPPTSGAVQVLGLPPDTGHRLLTGRVGTVVHHRTRLWADIRLGDSLSLLGRGLGLGDHLCRERITELVERLELTTLLRTRGGNLTIAQSRRAELAAALLPGPELLVLDEPTRGLDARGKQHLRSVLRQENRIHGRTLLLATSDLADVEFLCPRLLIGVDGRIGFDGDLPSLTARLGFERVLTVDLLEPAAALDDVPGAALIAIEPGGLRQRLGVVPGRRPVAQILGDVVARVPVRNLRVAEPDIADLVARLRV